MQKVVLAGGSGFLGRTLAGWFQGLGKEVTILSRSPVADSRFRQVFWDGEDKGEWCRELEGAEALINLAGRSVNCRYHTENRRQIMDSRVLSTHVLGRAIADCEKPPGVWIQSSTATIYKHSYDQPRNESGEIGPHPKARDAFSIKVAKAWEEAFLQTQTPATRRIIARTAMVFGAEPGGVYHVLRRLVRCGLGGTMGEGKQMVSWIHAEDFCRIIDWFITNEVATGVYNVCAPQPLRNSEMMGELRQALKAPIGISQPTWLLELGALMLRTETELVVKSRYVIPQRLEQEGFEFTYRSFVDAVRQLAATA